MKKKIGILFPLSTSGGIFQCALSTAKSLIDYCDEFDYSVIHYDSEELKSLFNQNLNNVQYVTISEKSVSFFRKILHFLGLFLGIKQILLKNIDAVLENIGVDLLIVPTPFSFDIPLKIPYVVFIPDLMHRYYPHFPEYKLEERISRDIIYKYYAKNALLNIVESEQGAEDLSRFFKIKKSQIRIIPVMPPNYIYDYGKIDEETAETILKKYELPENFLFYPAQFWYHKNHLRLVQAISLIKEKHKIKIPLVLVGNSKGHYEKIYKRVMTEVKKLGIEDQIVHLGYVSNREIVAIYKKAEALVFPSLIGPTSIPPLEAMVLGVPLICSNLFEMPKQVGGAGVLFDPFDTNDMAEKIYQLWINAELKEKLKKQGFIKTENITPEYFAEKWKKVVKDALCKL